MSAPEHDEVEKLAASYSKRSLVKAAGKIEGVFKNVLRRRSEDAGIQEVEQRP